MFLPLLSSTTYFIKSIHSASSCVKEGRCLFPLGVAVSQYFRTSRTLSKICMLVITFFIWWDHTIKYATRNSQSIALYIPWSWGKTDLKIVPTWRLIWYNEMEDLVMHDFLQWDGRPSHDFSSISHPFSLSFLFMVFSLFLFQGFLVQSV